ncbi:hypothetical protein A1O1_08174 [Capronia coronata CBS 617.96]|uniref:BZIP domain-containing protein n=1 Tax=Capronia coronata CBS 617.96 TaxID=1182541 RepID=W9XXL3_9EURO|nr:uncharacterized protein A1O1_08174 [Capronia coronata CBS 617.96]EXJ82105.1 hypothetical protein A1O1_08174 [Capronia coronata CBS 617.96]
MAMHYSQQPYYLYGHPQWPDDVKPALTEDDSSVLDDRVLDSSTPADLAAADSSDSRRPSMTKMEDEYVPPHVWQERPLSVMPPTRHFSQTSIPLSSPHGQYFGQGSSASCGPDYVQAQPWAVSTRSENNTPTPFFGAVQEPFGQQSQYNAGSANFSSYHQQDPASAISMSPQSSQGGWASTTSSEAAEAGHLLRHSRFRPASPSLVQRSDGIRKKNAKFEIPKDRNLANIDALIMQCANEEEKKELKQQKRLLRNRQAALDSRQRKKTHTERLEQEKRLFAGQKAELEETIAQLEETFQQEREQWLQQRQQCDQLIHQLQYDRDEAIRTKTLETAELRRMNNVLKETIRDLERQNTHPYSAGGPDTFSNDFANFKTLDLEDNWDDGFSLINSDDLKMEEPAHLQRQATPRPPTSSIQVSAASTAAKSHDIQVDAGFSWNTFYMCLLAGAFIVSQAGSEGPVTAPPAAVVTSHMPALSDDYRAEAGNVLNAVLSSGPESAHEVLPSRPAPSSGLNSYPSTAAGSDLSPMTTPVSGNPLGTLHADLTTPSRQQQMAAVFSLSAASYNHVANADGAFDSDEDQVHEVKPTRLQQLYAQMQAEKDGIEKLGGMGSKAWERSVLLDRVPEKVLRDFREMIARVE